MRGLRRRIASRRGRQATLAAAKQLRAETVGGGSRGRMATGSPVPGLGDGSANGSDEGIGLGKGGERDGGECGESSAGCSQDEHGGAVRVAGRGGKGRRRPERGRERWRREQRSSGAGNGGGSCAPETKGRRSGRCGARSEGGRDLARRAKRARSPLVLSQKCFDIAKHFVRKGQSMKSRGRLAAKTRKNESQSQHNKNAIPLYSPGPAG